jgi:phenylpropionate dioxygenase-like ring-hydroxylating dioxygenase large terminal subunit
MFMRNCWYVAATSDEVGGDPVGRILLDDAVVLFRADDGRVVALEDRCCHRHMPLSHGRLTAQGLQCGYHGLVFDHGGRCVEVPGQRAVPPGAAVRAYPIVERWGWIWIWMGAPARADESTIPDFHLLDAAGWQSTGERLHVRCHYQLLVDNLLDLSHLTFLHESTIGTAAVAETPVKTERQGDAVKVTRWMLDVAPPPTFVKLADFKGNIDRWQIATAAPPSYVWLEVGGAPTGAGAPDGDRGQGIERWNLNVITPETESSCHQFWAECRNFALDDPSVSALLFQQIHDTLLEDIEMLEAQQRMMDLLPDAPMIDINVDAGSIEARRVVDQRLADEAAGAG